MELYLKGKTVLVTGGSKGIGLGCCKVFAEEGCHVVMNYRSDEESARKNARELEDLYHVRVWVMKADVSREREVDTLYQKLDKNGIKLDYLVNNAANTKVQPTPFQEMTTDKWRRDQEGTLNSAFFVSRAFVKRAMEEERAAAIVNVVSKSAFLSSSIYNSPYVMAKGGPGAANEWCYSGLYGRNHDISKKITP